MTTIVQMFVLPQYRFKRLLIDFCLPEREEASFQYAASDPCRRFTFGLTIEDTDTRLWFCSCSAMIDSEKMDFNKVRFAFRDSLTELTYFQNPLILIFIFLAFTFASGSDLEWDDTMTSVLVGKIYNMKSKLAIIRTKQLTYYRISLHIPLSGVQLEFS